MGLLLYQLILAHVLCDFVLQSASMAKGKSRHLAFDLGVEERARVYWPYWLTAHAIIHGGAVWWVTGIIALGLVETIMHWIIDYAKCEGWTNIHSDQLLHLICKGIYLFFV